MKFTKKSIKINHKNQKKHTHIKTPKKTNWKPKHPDTTKNTFNFVLFSPVEKLRMESS